MLALFGYFLKKQLGKSIQDYIKVILTPIIAVGERDQVKKRMIQKNDINNRHLTYRNRPSKLTERLASWQKFFIDFQMIQKIINNASNQEEGKSVGDVCWEIFNILNDAPWGSKELNIKEDKIRQFIELLVELSVDILPEERNKEPVFCVIRKLLRQDYGPEDENERIAKQQRRQLIRKYKPDRVQIQTIHNAKGLQFKIVFLCSLNFAYTPEDDNIEIQATTDAERRREANRFRDSMIQKQNQELRLIYTAITRTSEFVYVSSSKQNIKKPNQYPGHFSTPSQHPQFMFLMKTAKNAQTIGRDKDLDEPLNKYYEKMLAKQKRRRGQEPIPNQRTQ